VASVHGSKLLVLGSERLAVSTPRSVELEKDILLIVDDKVLVRLGNHNCHTLLLLGNLLALDAGLNLASDEILEKLAEAFLAESSDRTRLSERKLLVLDRVLNGEGGPLANLEVEVAGMLTKVLGVNSGEVELALVQLRERLQGLCECRTLFSSLGEDVCEGDTSLG
jgi:hypothetical protein